MKRPAQLAQLCLWLFLAGIVTLHLLPQPLLYATTGKTIPYNPALNFMSEFVRTQYGPLMTANFFFLAVAAGALAVAVRAAGLTQETWFFRIATVFLLLLMFFPSDLADLRSDAYTCGDPTRVEPCTWVGRVHNPLSTVIFGVLGAAIVRLTQRRDPEWTGLVRAGWACGALALVLVGLSELYLIKMGTTGRLWVGLMQRSLTFPALLWLGLLARRLAMR